MSLSRSSSISKASIIEKDQLGDTLQTLPKSGDKRVVEVQSVLLTAAAKNGLQPWSQSSIALYGCTLVCCMCQFANGYGGSLMGSINAMTPYVNSIRNGTPDSSWNATWDVPFWIYTIGGIVSPFVTMPMIDKLGRRAGIFFGAVLVLLTTAVLATAQTKPHFIVGRLLVGMTVSVFTTAAPTYLVEIAPPQWRGRMGGLYGASWYAGAIVAMAVVFGTQNITSNLAWRLPLIIQIVPAIIIIGYIWILPESPRWHYLQQRNEEALAFLVRYHGNGDPNHPVVKIEWQQFKDGISTNGADKKPSSDISDLIGTRPAQWRFGMGLVMCAIGQFANNVTGYYNAPAFTRLGYSPNTQSAINICIQLAAFASALVSASRMDRMSRRKQLVFGNIGLGVCILLYAALCAKWATYTVGEENPSVAQGLIALHFFFHITYGFTYIPLFGVYPAESLKTDARGKGMGNYATNVAVTLIVVQFLGPFLFNLMKSYTLWIFGFFALCEGGLWYIVGVETVGRSLEELEDVFTASYPPKANPKTVVAIRDNGDVEVMHAA